MTPGGRGGRVKVLTMAMVENVNIHINQKKLKEIFQKTLKKIVMDKSFIVLHKWSGVGVGGQNKNVTEGCILNQTLPLWFKRCYQTLFCKL